MKILFITSTLPRFEGDSQSPFVLEQAVAWKKAKPLDQVYILAPDDVKAKKEEVIDGVSIVRYSYFYPRTLQQLVYPAILPNIRRNPLLLLQIPFLLIAQLFSLVHLVKKENIDCIYAHWAFPQGLIADVGSWILDHRSFVVQNHSSDLRLFIKIPLIGKVLARHLIKQSRVFFCVNSLLKKEALSLFSLSDRQSIEKKIVVLPMGVNIGQGSKIQDQGSKYDFGFIGRLTAKKGVLEFLEALNTREETIRVAIAGDGELKDQLMTLPLKKNIHIDFLGNIKGEEKQNFFHTIRALVVPSIQSKNDIEGIPVSLLEGLWYGLKIVTTPDSNVHLLPEWNDLERYVTLVKNPQDQAEFGKILAYVLKQRLASDEGKKLSLIMKRYEWKNLINEYISTINI